MCYQIQSLAEQKYFRDIFRDPKTYVANFKRNGSVITTAACPINPVMFAN